MLNNISVTRMSSKGQIVIPRGLRAGFNEGDSFIVIRSKNRLVLKSAGDFKKNVAEDVRFAERTEEALKRYEAGCFKSVSGEKFLEELEKW